MTHLPEPSTSRPHTPPTGQPTINPTAHAFLNDLESAFTQNQLATNFRDQTPAPAIGTTPPVPQPGRPPMSQRAVDLNTTILSTSILVAMTGGTASAALWASGQANPTVIAWIVAGIIAAPAALAIPALALKSLMKSAKQAAEAAPPVIHHHYTGTVHQDTHTLNTTNRGIIANTRNQLPQ